MTPTELYLSCGDSVAVMKTIIASGGPQIDLVMTDPPYKLTSGGKSGLMRGIFDPENYDNGGSIVQCDIDWSDFMPLLYGVLKENSHAYVMANNRNVQAMLNSAEAAGFGFHNLLVWDKITATANRWYMKNLEFIGFFYKGYSGRPRQINDCSAKQLIRCPQVDETKHPTEKPVALMQHYIRNSSKEGDLVFDPFMGTGTTGVAALQLGRRFWGVEINEKFFHNAETRIAAAKRVKTLNV